MSEFRIESTRGPLVESIHHVSCAVTDPNGVLIAAAGNPELVTFWRSAAKPFQALPLVEDGGVERFGLTGEDLALTCASHSSETRHLEATDRFMHRIGCAESDLACGIHPPLSPAVAKSVAQSGITMTPRWSNCSGKHTGMLALARLHGWPTTGYERAGHPVQARILDSVAAWTWASKESIVQAVDGCAAVCFGLPLRAMALAYARFGVAVEPAPTNLREAMIRHPELVAGDRRLCTDIMIAWPGEIVAKIGAEGIYCATVPRLGLGVALKVEDGDMACAGVALVGVLRQVIAQRGGAEVSRFPFEPLAAYSELPIRNTRQAMTGRLRSAGALHFIDSARV